MQVKIKTTSGVIPDNLTIGKIYSAERVDSERMRLTCDDGQLITSNIKKSGYLSDSAVGGEWEIVSE